MFGGRGQRRIENEAAGADANGGERIVVYHRLAPDAAGLRKVERIRFGPLGLRHLTLNATRIINGVRRRRLRPHRGRRNRNQDQR